MSRSIGGAFRARLRAAVVVLVATTCCVTAVAASYAHTHGVDVEGAVFRHAQGIEWCPNSQVLSSWGITQGGDIALGRFDEQGRTVLDGDAVLLLAADLGDAPVSELAFPFATDVATGRQMILTPERPFAVGTLNVSGQNWNQGLGFQPELRTLSEGSGTATIRLALVQRSTDPWNRVPGVTTDLRISVGSCRGAVFPYSPYPLSIGSAGTLVPPLITYLQRGR
jgi:hypothetical protein